MLRLLMMTSIALLVTGQALADSDGPFGVSKGSDPTSYGCSAMNQSGYFSCKAMPKMHPDLTGYVVQAAPGLGTCWVKGISDPISSDSYGSALRAKVDDLAKQLSSVYGKGKKHDELLPGSIWSDANEWTMGLKQNERQYYYEWSPSTGAKMKADLNDVYVSAAGTSSSDGYVSVEFYFDNYDACQAALKASAASAF